MRKSVFILIFLVSFLLFSSIVSAQVTPLDIISKFFDSILKFLGVTPTATQEKVIPSSGTIVYEPVLEFTVGVDYYSQTPKDTLNKRDLQHLKNAGIQMVRLEFNKNSVDDLRELVPIFVDNKIQVLGLLMEKSYQPKSSSDPGDPTGYGNWVYDVVSEFKDDVHVWEIWNEPNLANFFVGQNAVTYTNYLKAAYNKIKGPDGADTSATVLGGSVCFTRSSSQTWVHTLYDNGAKDYMDALSFHPYVDGYRSPAATGGNNPYTDLPKIHDIMVEHGDTRPLWITELGWESAKISDDGTTTDQKEQAQGDYHALALTMAKDWGWVGAYIVYNWHADSNGEDEITYGSAPTLKPAYYSIKNWIAANI